MAKRISRRRLATMGALADEMLSVYDDARDLLLDTNDARNLVSILRSVAELRQAEDMEGRVNDLQQRLKERDRA